MGLKTLFWHCTINLFQHVLRYFYSPFRCPFTKTCCSCSSHCGASIAMAATFVQLQKNVVIWVAVITHNRLTECSITYFWVIGIFGRLWLYLLLSYVCVHSGDVAKFCFISYVASCRTEKKGFLRETRLALSTHRPSTVDVTHSIMHHHLTQRSVHCNNAVSLLHMNIISIHTSWMCVVHQIV